MFIRFLERTGRIETPGELDGNFRLLDAFLAGLRRDGYAAATIKLYRYRFVRSGRVLHSFARFPFGRVGAGSPPTGRGKSRHLTDVGDHLDLLARELLEGETEGDFGFAVIGAEIPAGGDLDHRPGGVPDRDAPECARALAMFAGTGLAAGDPRRGRIALDTPAPGACGSFALCADAGGHVLGVEPAGLLPRILLRVIGVAPWFSRRTHAGVAGPARRIPLLLAGRAQAALRQGLGPAAFCAQTGFDAHGGAPATRSRSR